MRKKRLEACIFRAFSLFCCQRWDYNMSGHLALAVIGGCEYNLDKPRWKMPVAGVQI